MRVVHYLPHLRPEAGGSMRAALDICSAVAAQGESVTILTQQDPLPVELEGRGLAIAHVGAAGVLGRAFTARQRGSVERILRDADVAHLHDVWEPSTVQVAAAARRGRTPYVVTPHGALSQWPMAQRSLLKRLHLLLASRRMLERAAVLHLTADEERRQVDVLVRARRSTTVPCVVDVAQFEQSAGKEIARTALGLKPGRDPVLLFLGRLHKKKRPDIAIRALSELRRRGLDASLVVAGPGDNAMSAALRRLVTRFELEDRVVLAGPVGGAVKRSCYELADVMVLPTHQENFGLVAVEALACGTPVVTTKGCDIWRELESSGGATIVGLDASEFADAVEGILSSGDRGRHMGSRGRAWVERTLSPQAVASSYQQLYSDAVEGKTDDASARSRRRRNARA